MTRAILLAAGQGSRLRPYTDRCPKAMVPLQGRPLLDWQLSALREAGVDEVIVVSGYRGESIDFEGIVKLDNPAFASTNMVWSLLQARPYWGDGFLLCYTDIVYEPRLIQALMAAQGPVSMIVSSP